MKKIIPEGFGPYVLAADMPWGARLYDRGEGRWISTKALAVRFNTIGQGNRKLRDLQRCLPNIKPRQIAKVEKYDG